MVESLTRAARLTERARRLNLVPHDASADELAKAFRKEFGARAPDVKTLKKIFSGNEAVIESLRPSGFDKADQCLRISNRFHDGYHALLKGMAIKTEARVEASTIVGDYIYYRLDVGNNVTSGGIRLTADYGINRFWHFNSAADFKAWRAEEASGKNTEQNLPYSHKGFYFKQGDRLTMIGFDTTYFRSMMGGWETVGGLKHRPLSLVILARSEGGGVFAAKSVMYSERHPRFEDPLSDEEVLELLSPSDSPAILQFTQG